MSQSSYVIGVDGGGTSTVARLVDPQGNVLAVTTVGPSNLSISGPEKCAETLIDAVAKACSEASVGIGQVEYVVYGTAGAGRHADRESLHAAIVSRWNSMADRPKRLKVVSDADIALESAHGEDPGIILIAGTGSIVYGRDIDGTIRRAGGWGPIIGDAGSGTAIGIRALRYVASVLDGCTGATLLMRVLSEETGITSHASLIDTVYKDKYQPSALAPLVIRAASEGDRHALAILQECAEELVNLLLCSLRQFSYSDVVPIAYVGGLLQSHTLYPELVTKLIREKVPHADIRMPRVKPEEGAVAMALRLASKPDNLK